MLNKKVAFKTLSKTIELANKGSYISILLSYSLFIFKKNKFSIHQLYECKKGIYINKYVKKMKKILLQNNQVYYVLTRWCLDKNFNGQTQLLISHIFCPQMSIQNFTPLVSPVPNISDTKCHSVMARDQTSNNQTLHTHTRYFSYCCDNQIVPASTLHTEHSKWPS